MLGKAATKKVHQAVDELFDKLEARFLGPNLFDKRLAVGYREDLSLPGLYEAAAKDQGASPSDTTLNALLSVAHGYLEAQRARTKAQVVQGVNDFLQEAKHQGVDTDWRTVLGGQLAEQFERLSNDARRIVDSEAQNGRSMGALEGLTRVNAQQGIEDPVVFFVVVRDDHVCDECMRLHMLDDETTPRLWYLSEVGAGYHTKGDPNPKIRGLHPHCRCSLTTLMPGWGFDAGGKVTWIGPEHDEIKKQRGLQKKEDLDAMIKRLRDHRHQGCDLPVPLRKSEAPAVGDLDKLIMRLAT